MSPMIMDPPKRKSSRDLMTATMPMDTQASDLLKMVKLKKRTNV